MLIWMTTKTQMINELTDLATKKQTMSKIYIYSLYILIISV